MLRTEGCGQPQVGQRRQSVEGVGKVSAERSGMGQQRQAAAAQRLAQLRLAEQTVESELQGGHPRFLQAGCRGGASSKAKPSRR
jgi:hypothetical protein